MALAAHRLRTLASKGRQAGVLAMTTERFPEIAVFSKFGRENLQNLGSVFWSRGLGLATQARTVKSKVS